MIDMASHSYILCYVCACNSVQLCGSISERAGLPDAFLTEVLWTYFHFVYDSTGYAVYWTSVSCHIKCKMQLILLASMSKDENLQILMRDPL